jgi:hypothetical protein
MMHGYEAHIMILTHFEGLCKDEMEFCIKVVHDGKIIDQSVAQIRGPAKSIGWNLYLNDLLESTQKSSIVMNRDLN